MESQEKQPVSPVVPQSHRVCGMCAYLVVKFGYRNVRLRDKVFQNRCYNYFCFLSGKFICDDDATPLDRRDEVSGCLFFKYTDTVIKEWDAFEKEILCQDPADLQNPHV